MNFPTSIETKACGCVASITWGTDGESLLSPCAVHDGPFPRVELPRRPDGSVDEDAIRAQLIRGCVSYVVKSAPPVDITWPEPTTPFLLRTVPTLLIYALTFVVYGLLIAILSTL